MRHRKGFNHLGRTSAHRKALLANMATSLILHKRISTTTAKAKALRSYVEPLITRSKDDSTHSRRVVFSYLRNKFAVSELFREISPKVTDRPGGYTRILKVGNRLGDNADMCIIELVDYNETMLADTGKKAKSTRRRRLGSKKKVSEGKTVAATDTTIGEVTEIESVDEQMVEVTNESVGDEIVEAQIEVSEEAEAEAVEEVVAGASQDEPEVNDTDSEDTSALDAENEEDKKE
ncbi:MAG TPA: 50S ribosomal protein L17 [Bacteroidales bacterium]|nr:50S ribosomal protein L17 [Bacteroidales bacterium]